MAQTDLPDNTVHLIRRAGLDRIADIRERCKHFTGLGNGDCCKAGVKYADVSVKGTFKYRDRNGPVYTHGNAHPCIKRYAFGGATCPKAEWPTQEEAQAEVDESERDFNKIINARKSIVEHIAQTGKNNGHCKCPECGGELHYRKAQSNGHIHARCDKEGCVAWME